jgi:hypothetical protein
MSRFLPVRFASYSGSSATCIGLRNMSWGPGFACCAASRIVASIDTCWRAPHRTNADGSAYCNAGCESSAPPQKYLRSGRKAAAYVVAADER